MYLRYGGKRLNVMKLIKMYKKEIAALVGAVITFFATGGELHITRASLVIQMPWVNTASINRN
jgi:hypothetical protein